MTTNYSAFDVADYILQRLGPMSAMKLQKVVYYAQAWSLVWDDRALFHEKIEAWIGGPVVRELYEARRGQFDVAPGSLRANPAALDQDARETIDSVIQFYGHKEGYELSQLTHAERPWQEARVGLAPDDRGNHEITLPSMQEYYSGVAAAGV
jgi:uncharacterized phage-associated protein